MDMKQHENFMRKAIDLSAKGSLVEKAGGVFGCVIVKDGKVIGEGYNQVVKQNDPTWHAEMQAIREACKKLGTPHLKGAILYTSAESCPMCLAAAYWAQIDQLFYGALVSDARKYGNFQDDDIYSEIRKSEKDRKIKHTQILRNEAVEVWKKFAEMPDHVHY